jgi:hypothetical protein
MNTNIKFDEFLSYIIIPTYNAAAFLYRKISKTTSEEICS